MLIKNVQLTHFALGVNLLKQKQELINKICLP